MFATRKTALTIVFGTLAPFAGGSFAVAQEDGSRAMLEEITVTAQRREQSLQEVPISIETITGLEIQRQGFRDLNELANFSPSVYIDESGFLSQDRSIRGFGTSGNALTLEQAVPIFVDGIHFGRSSQVKLAFLDVGRVEILKGPQPVYFGMSATAGAFNITSAGPTDEWEGYLDTEFGNNSTSVFRGAIGGPLSETVGIRLSGTYESAGGFIEDVVNGKDLGAYENFGGRAIIEFTPSDKLTISGKVEYSEIDKDNEATSLCLTDGTLLYGRRGPTDDPGELQGPETSIWAPAPKGVGWTVPFTALDTVVNPKGGKCFDDKGVSNGGPFYAPPENIREENSNFGAMDARAAVDEWVKMVGISNGIGDVGESIESSNGYVSVDYQFDNDVEVEWKTGYSTMDRANSRDNSNTPFLLNMQNRGEDFDQYSSELRFSSVGETIEWQLGMFWQKTDHDIISNSPRPAVRRGLRYNEAWEEQEWKSVFGSVTFNFLDGKASIDLGARYTDLEKIGGIRGLAGQWVYDVAPCNPRGADPANPANPDPATCDLHEDALQITAADTEFLLPNADVNNLWIIPWRASRNTPLSWIGSRASAVGLTALADLEGDGPYGPNNGGDFSTKETDPQVTIRYRPTENHSLFLRYAEAFKAGGFDTGVTSIPGSVDDFRFEGESGKTYELGAKGDLWDGRARYDLTFFETTFDDFQVQEATGNVDDPFRAANAGQQQVSGVEFSLTAAATDNLTLMFAGALMDGEFTYYPDAACNLYESRNAATGPCRTAEEAAELGNPDLEDTIDRTGTAAPKTPDWKFVLGVDYQKPLDNNYVVSVNAKGYISDGFITDASGFEEIISMNAHEDMNVTVGFGPESGDWEVALYGRNLLEARVEYNAKYDLAPQGQRGTQLSRSDFKSYGLKFRYNF